MHDIQLIFGQRPEASYNDLAIASPDGSWIKRPRSWQSSVGAVLYGDAASLRAAL
jgi:hypothetical protein